MTTPLTTASRELPPVLPPLPWPQQVRLGFTDVAVDFRYRRRNPALRKRPSPRALDPRLHRPIFVIGAPRSGTTFLGDCIGAMPEVSYHFEPRLTKATIGHVYDGSWTPQRGARVFRLTYTALLLAALHGGRRFSDKTPENSFVVPFLAQLFPAAQFVHIIRDGRDAAVSHAEKPWLTAAAAQGTRRGAAGQLRGPYPRWWVEEDRRAEFSAVSDIVRTAWCWRRFTQAAMDGLATLDSGRRLEVRYESVVADPMAAATALGDFLGASTAGRQALRTGLAGARPSSVGRWRKTLSEQQIAEVEREIGPLLNQLGYTGRAGSDVAV
jgi:Sulfotransferase family